MVLYTGPETKLILNQGKYNFKQSKLDQMINIFLGWNVAAMLLFSAALSYGCYNFVLENKMYHSYLFMGSADAKTQAVQVFGSFYLLNNSFIPLDIAVGLEVAKLIYVYFIENDVQMFVIDTL